MYVLGQLIKAQLEVLGADPTPVSTGLVYFSTVSLVPKFYNGTDWKTLVDTNTAQVLTLKDYDGGTASDTSRITLPKAATSALDSLTRKAGTVVYDTSTNQPKYDDGSTLKAFGGGAGELNLIENPNDASAGWVASAAGITVATSTTEAELPLGPLVASAILITPVSGTDYVYTRFTLPESLKNRKLKIEWYQRYLSSYATGDLKVELHVNSQSDYAGSYTEVDLTTDSSGTSAIPAANGKYATTFDSDSSDYCELRIVRVAGTSPLSITNVIVGPGIQPQGAVVGAVATITPTFTASFGTTSNVDFRYYRVGQYMYLYGKFQVGTTTGATAGITLPAGFTVDSSALEAKSYLGEFTEQRSTSTALYPNTRGVIFFNNDSGAIAFTKTSNSNVYVADNADVVSGSNRFIDLQARIPIAQWAGSGTVNLAQNDVEYASVGGTWDAASTTTVYGPSGFAIGGTLAGPREKTITWQTPVQPTDRIQVWGSKDRINWFPINGCFLGSTNLGVVPSMEAAGGAPRAGVNWRPGATAYETIVTFARYINIANDDAPAENWPSSDAFWVVTKSRAGQAVGFGTVSQNSSGLMPANHSNLDDAAATRLGLKSYTHGVSYAGGNQISISSTASSWTYGSTYIIPKQMQDGSWRLEFSIVGTLAAGQTSVGIVISGISFAVDNQAITLSTNTGTVNRCITNVGTGEITVSVNSSSTGIRMSGIVSLSAKPTWAY